jgi:hypothetical protein
MDDKDLCGQAAAYLVRPDSDQRLPILSRAAASVLTDLGNGLRVGYVAAASSDHQHLGGDHPISTSLYYRDPTHRDWRPYSL